MHVDPDVLLVDEVLAVGDEPFQRKCLARIREFQDAGKTIVLVSHSAEQIADVCTRTIVLDSGKIVFDGEVGAVSYTHLDVYDRQPAGHTASRRGVAIGVVLGISNRLFIQLRAVSTGGGLGFDSVCFQPHYVDSVGNAKGALVCGL